MTSPPAGLRYRALWLPIGWLLVALVIWGTLTPSPPGVLTVGSDKLDHVAAYLVLTLWFAGLYSGVALGAHAAGLAALGIGLEFLQEAGGTRQLQVTDMLANGLGVVAGWLLSLFPSLDVVGRLDRALGYLRTGSAGQRPRG